MEDVLNPNDSFRDVLSTVDESGKRIWLYPKKPKGPLYKARKVVAYLLIAFMAGVPFIKVHGHPIFLFNIFERKFILFGQVFWPQDFHLFALGMLVFVIFIVLFTVVFGRVWCGWTCPQTVFLELVFRPIEYLIEGDAQKQKRLQEGPWTPEKIRKRILKHSIFLFLSFLIAHIVLAWIIGIEQVIDITTTSPAANLTGFIAMMATTGVIYGIFARFREQMCTTFCPYGRLQGVLLGDDSMVVAYDYERGEPREKYSKNRSEELGDCIDCFNCVKVCPTGIDIRNGTQLECVNCTACIDACDEIMEHIGKPKKLIGFNSDKHIKSGEQFNLSTRMKAYIGVLILLTGVLVALLFLRSDIETTILRNPGTLYQIQDNGMISNLYKLNIVNKTYEDIELNLDIQYPGAKIRYVGKSQEVKVPGEENITMMMFVDLPLESIQKVSTKIKFEVTDQKGRVVDNLNTTFLGTLKK